MNRIKVARELTRLAKELIGANRKAYESQITYERGMLTFEDGTSIPAPPALKRKLGREMSNITYSGGRLIFEDGTSETAPREIEKAIG